jgi:hypothetical protein
MPLSNSDARMTAYGTSLTSRDVRLESATSFDRFAAAKHRRSDFAVTVSWKDVEIIETLCEAGCPEALAARESRKLATGDFIGIRNSGLEHNLWPRIGRINPPKIQSCRGARAAQR